MKQKAATVAETKRKIKERKGIKVDPKLKATETKSNII